jgi:hypothetical protein
VRAHPPAREKGVHHPGKGKEEGNTAVVRAHASLCRHHRHRSTAALPFTPARDLAVAASVLQLEGITFRDRPLRIKRPHDFNAAALAGGVRGGGGRGGGVGWRAGAAGGG